jgi:hypothetical protein
LKASKAKNRTSPYRAKAVVCSPFSPTWTLAGEEHSWSYKTDYITVVLMFYVYIIVSQAKPDHPLHQGGIQVAGDHGFFLVRVLTALNRIGKITHSLLIIELVENAVNQRDKEDSSCPDGSSLTAAYLRWSRSERSALPGRDSREYQ